MDVLLLISSCRKANKYLYAVNQDIVILQCKIIERVMVIVVETHVFVLFRFKVHQV